MALEKKAQDTHHSLRERLRGGYSCHSYRGLVGEQDESLTFIISFSQIYGVMKYSWPIETGLGGFGDESFETYMAAIYPFMNFF